MSEPLVSLLERVALSFAWWVRRLDRCPGEEIAEARSWSCARGPPYHPVTTSFLRT